MDAPEKKDSKKADLRSRGFISNFTADMIAIGSSIAAGAVTAWSQIQSHAYRNLSALDAFEDMKPRRKAEFKEINEQLQKGHITPEQSYHRIDDLIERNEHDALKRMEEFGIGSVRDRWHILRQHQRLEVVTWSIVASGVAIGSVMQLLRKPKDKEEQEKKDDNPRSV